MKKSITISFFLISIMLVETSQKIQAQNFQFEFGGVDFEVNQSTGQCLVTTHIYQTNPNVGDMSQMPLGFIPALYMRQTGQSTPDFSDIIGPQVFSDSIHGVINLSSGDYSSGVEYKVLAQIAVVDNGGQGVIGMWESDTMLYTITNITTSINSNKEIFFSLYPNPTKDIMTIEAASGKGIYQLQDVTGKVLLSGTITATKFNLDISALSKGIYLLSLIDGEHQVNRKIVKE